MTKEERNLKKLQKYFRIYKDKDKNTVSMGKVTYPKDKVDKDGHINIDDITIKPIEMPSDVRKAYNYFRSDYFSISHNKKDRFDRYLDLDFMTKNEGLMGTACQIYADETVQCDEQNRVIVINARKKEIEKNFYEWFNDVGFTKNLLHDIAWNVTLYGDSFLINSIDLNNGGVTEVVPISVYNVYDRMEFNSVKIKEFMKNSGYMSNFASFLGKNNSFKDLYNMMTKSGHEDYASSFKSYLFGYNINDDYMLPPWMVTHFRLYTTDDVFHPFGMPIFIKSIARYKSFKTTELLMDMARVATFPKEIYKIATVPGMTLVEIFNRVNMVREQFLNITKDTRNPDELSVGEPIFTVDGLFEYELIQTDIDIDKISDYEKKREDLIISTGIPEGYLILSDRSSFGQSGKSLIQQSKLFGRRVYTIQTAMLEEISNLYRVHLLISGQYDLEATDFELSMNFPVTEETDEKIESQKNSLELASDLVAKITELMGLDADEHLPLDVIKDIYSKYSFLDDNRLDGWIKSIEKSRVEKDKQSTESSDSNAEFNFEERKLKEKKIREKIKERMLSEDMIRETFFNVKKQNSYNEGIYSGRHFYTSWSRGDRMFEESLTLLKKDMVSRRLKERNIQSDQKELEF